MRKKLTGPKIRRGQVWRRNSFRNPFNAVHDVLITLAGDHPRGKQLDKTHIQHHYKTKTLWLYYDLIGTEHNYPPMPPEKKR